MWRHGCLPFHVVHMHKICKSHYLLFDDMLFVSNFRVYCYHVLQRHRSPTVVCIRISTTFMPFWRPQRKSASRTPKYTSSEMVAKSIIVNGDAGRIKGYGFLDCLVDGTPEPRTNQNDGEVESFELLSVEDVLSNLLDGQFKPSSALALVDFLIRHGHVTEASDPRYVEVCLMLRRDLVLPVPWW